MEPLSFINDVYQLTSLDHAHTLLKASFYTVALLLITLFLDGEVPIPHPFYLIRAQIQRGTSGYLKPNLSDYTYKGSFLLCLYIYISEVVNWWLRGCKQPTECVVVWLIMLVKILNLLPTFNIWEGMHKNP